jgi:hypothetical protein
MWGGNFRHKVNYRCYCHCTALEFILLLEGLLKEEMVEFSNSFLLGKLHGKTMAGNVVTSEVEALPYVVVSRVEEHVPNGELIRNTERITL